VHPISRRGMRSAGAFHGRPLSKSPRSVAARGDELVSPCGVAVPIPSFVASLCRASQILQIDGAGIARKLPGSCRTQACILRATWEQNTRLLCLTPIRKLQKSKANYDLELRLFTLRTRRSGVRIPRAHRFCPFVLLKIQVERLTLSRRDASGASQLLSRFYHTKPF